MWPVQEGVRTFSVRVGVKNVFWTCIMLLEIAYAGALGVGLASQVLPVGLPRFILQSSLGCHADTALDKLCLRRSPLGCVSVQLHH